MKKVWLTVLAGALAVLPFVPVRAADDDSEKHFDFDGMVRARYEYLNNYLDLADKIAGVDSDDHLGVAPYRVIVGMTGNFAKNISAHVDLQYTGHLGDEWNPSKDSFTFPGPMGQADAAYQFNTQGVQLYTGYLEMSKIGGSNVSLRLGRQEHTYGTELLMGDNDFYSGLSFDGLRGMWQMGHGDLNAFYYKIASANCNFGFCAPIGGSDNSNFWGFTYDWNFDKWGTVGGNVLVSQDLGGFGPIFAADSEVTTYGARWHRGMMSGDKLNMFDWNIEYNMQSGDAGEPAAPNPKIKLAGWIGEGWFGFNYNAGNSHGRVHIGTLMTSGDKLDTTDKSEAFVNLYGDFHANNRFGDLDWIDQFGPSNITDYNIGYEHWFAGGNHYVMFAYHTFKETESNNATLGSHDDKLGDEIDLKYAYRYSKNLSFEVMLGQAMPNDKYWVDFAGFLPPGSKTDAVQRASLQAKLSW